MEGVKVELSGPTRIAHSERHAGAWPAFYDNLAPITAAADAASIILISILTGVGYHLLALGEVNDPSQLFGVGATVAAILIPLLILRGAYRPTTLHSFRASAGTIAALWCVVILFLISLAFLMKVSHVFSRGAVLSLAVVGLPLLLVQRYCLTRFIAQAARSGRLQGRRVVVLTDQPTELSGEVGMLRRYGFRPTRIFQISDNPNAGELRTIVERVLAFARGSDVEEIHLVLQPCHLENVGSLLSAFRATPLPVRLIPSGAAAELLRHPQAQLGNQILFELQRAPLSAAERVSKRVLDIMLAGIGLWLLAPLFVAVAIAVRLDSRGPVLFRQMRNGFNGRPFEIYKFRTMNVMENGAVVVQAQRNDRRVTRVGRWLRRTSIDELPQLLNVLRGEMSLVGPRPHAMAHDDQYMQLIGTYAYRHHVKPGITGWAQVHGFRGETPTVDAMERRVELDRWYIENWSFWLDISILCRTVVEVMRTRNAY